MKKLCLVLGTLIVGLFLLRLHDLPPDGVSAATPPGSPVVAVVRSDLEGLPNPAPPGSKLSYRQVEDMVGYAMALAGISQVVGPGTEWVVIKPNIVNLESSGSGAITDCRVVKAIIRTVHRLAPSARITVAEGAGGWAPPDKDLEGISAERGDGLEVAGYRDLLEDPDLSDVDLDIVDLNFDRSVKVQVPGGGNCLSEYYLPETVLDCDVLIDVPVLKVTGVVGMTVAMKNLIGILPGMVYGWPKMTGYPPGKGPGLPHAPQVLDEVIVDIATLAHVDFTVVDAIVGMEGARIGREGGDPVRMNTVVAGRDIVAVDAVCARLMGFNPDDFEFLTLAAWRGLGICDLEKIVVKGSDLEAIARRFRKHPDEYGSYGQGNRTWLLKGPFPKGEEESVDPEDPKALPGRNGWSVPVYFYDDKIDLAKYFRRPKDCVVYAFANFEVPRGGRAELWVGSDEGLVVWMDGRKVYEFHGRRRHHLPNDRVPIELEEGVHSLLVRAEQSYGRFSFSVNICEPEHDPRYAGNRVRGLKFFVPGKEEVREVRPPSTGRVPEGAKVVRDARFVRRANTLIGALEGAFRALGDTLSPVWAMGASGQAFRTTIADSLFEYGPGNLDWEEALPLLRNLGREIRLIYAEPGDPDFGRKQEEAWDAVVRSVDEGVPAVAKVGPFFWLVRGYHPEEKVYYISAYASYFEEPVEAEALGEDGGLAVLIVGRRVKVDTTEAVLESLRFALREARRRAPEGSQVFRGLEAMKRWADMLESGRFSPGLGSGYTAMVVYEARRFASMYLKDVATLFPEGAKDLREASRLYGREAKKLGRVRRILPIMREPEVPSPDDLRRAADLVREAEELEEEALRALGRVLR